ncbi:DDE-type integrase/transposase/recombinase [Pseudovibrio sp. W64]|uniref:DDE-type integrase/transposase/recombinase n=1 Tax=Pseudovibrio sp. W64 TaxID=1735583 RepID=UPI001290397B
MTYCVTEEGWRSVVDIKDIATREIVGWAMDKYMKASLLSDVCNIALARRRVTIGLIQHSDLESPSRSEEYRKLRRETGVRQSMCSVGK